MESLIEMKPEWNEKLESVAAFLAYGPQMEAARIAKELEEDLAEYTGPAVDIARERLSLLVDGMNVAA
ncbi:hypothetical protein [Magnetospira sp. QH-2]|uniref:hypothetical protein n=1 Tax=Magnetospira sp. (strain QH-2) TaxID=1288970 RepID=UPI0005FA4F6C|nr:hypothetical protein [Magnetospira sp. QH-2]